MTHYALAQLHVLDIVMQSALAGGVTRSLDAHGKTLASMLLNRETREQAVRSMAIVSGQSRREGLVRSG